MPAVTDLSSGRRSQMKRAPAGPSFATNMDSLQEDDTDVFGRAKLLPRYENTFKMTPDINIKLKVKPIRDIIEQALKHACTREYSAQAAKTMVMNATTTIHREIKTLKLDRYKTVCHVFVGEHGQHDMKHASKCLWDPSMDTVVDSCLVQKDKNLVAFATVYCVYFE